MMPPTVPGNGTHKHPLPPFESPVSGVTGAAGGIPWKHYAPLIQVVLLAVAVLFVSGVTLSHTADLRYTLQSQFDAFRHGELAVMKQDIATLHHSVSEYQRVMRVELLRSERRQLRREAHYLEQIIDAGTGRLGDNARLLELRDDIAHIDRQLQYLIVPHP